MANFESSNLHKNPFSERAFFSKKSQPDFSLFKTEERPSSAFLNELEKRFNVFKSNKELTEGIKGSCTPLSKADYLENLKKLNFDDRDISILEERVYLTSEPLIEWCKIFEDKAASFRGVYGETLFHWAAIGNISLIKILAENDKLNLNQVDNNGNTAFDWLIDKYIQLAFMNINKFSEQQRKAIAQQCILNAVILYRMGVASRLDPIIELGSRGAFGFIESVLKHFGADKLNKLGDRETSFTHLWLLIEDSPAKYSKLKQFVLEYGVDIFQQDYFGLTPLASIVDGLAFNNKLKKNFISSAKTLIELGADINKDLSAWSLYQRYKNSSLKEERRAMTWLKNELNLVVNEEFVF